MILPTIVAILLTLAVPTTPVHAFEIVDRDNCKKGEITVGCAYFPNPDPESEPPQSSDPVLKQKSKPKSTEPKYKRPAKESIEIRMGRIIIGGGCYVPAESYLESARETYIQWKAIKNPSTLQNEDHQADLEASLKTFIFCAEKELNNKK